SEWRQGKEDPDRRQVGRHRHQRETVHHAADQPDHRTNGAHHDRVGKWSCCLGTWKIEPTVLLVQVGSEGDVSNTLDHDKWKGTRGRRDHRHVDSLRTTAAAPWPRTP